MEHFKSLSQSVLQETESHIAYSTKGFPTESSQEARLWGVYHEQMRNFLRREISSLSRILSTPRITMIYWTNQNDSHAWSLLKVTQRGSTLPWLKESFWRPPTSSKSTDLDVEASDGMTHSGPLQWSEKWVLTAAFVFSLRQTVKGSSMQLALCYVHPPFQEIYSLLGTLKIQWWDRSGHDLNKLTVLWLPWSIVHFLSMRSFEYPCFSKVT